MKAATTVACSAVMPEVCRALNRWVELLTTRPAGSRPRGVHGPGDVPLERCRVGSVAGTTDPVWKIPYAGPVRAGSLLTWGVGSSVPGAPPYFPWLTLSWGTPKTRLDLPDDQTHGGDDHTGYRRDPLQAPECTLERRLEGVPARLARG